MGIYELFVVSENEKTIDEKISSSNRKSRFK